MLLSRARFFLGLGLLATGLLLPAGVAHGQPAKGKINRKTVPFKTFDGVELSGTLYPSAGAKARDAVVLLLHDFDLKKGGSSQQAGWTHLAATLQADGYVVLAFDFRGFGSSTTVDKAFWNFSHNGPGSIRKGRGKAAIDHKDFSASYLQYLVNDIAAAKAYLDRRNDDKELNSSSVILIGAGEGATLGAMWLAGECRRARDKTGFGQLGEPEVKDIAAAIWVTISPKIGSRTVSGTLGNWAREAGGKQHKVPTLFVYGQKDAQADNLSLSLIKSINPAGAKNKDLKRTGRKAIADTRLSGQLLLDKDFETVKVIKDHLKEVMEDRGSRERAERKADKHLYVYTTKQGKYFKNNKPVGQEVPSVDLGFVFGIR